MADDTQTTVLGSDIPNLTFNATKDGSNNLTLQSTPRTNGSEVTAANPLPVTNIGSGGAVTIADAADVTQGAVADVAYVSGNGTAISVLKGIFGKVSALLGVNIAQVNGVSVAVGHGVAATALRVELPTDGTGIVGLAAGVNNIGTVAITGGGLAGTVTLAAGSANVGTVAVSGAIAGTVTLAAGSGTIGALTANQSVNISQVSGASIALGATGAANGIPIAFPTDQSFSGTITSGTVTLTGTPAVSALQSGTWTMQPGNTPNTSPWLVDVNGGLANALAGFITTTASTSATLIASPGTASVINISSMQLGNTDSVLAVVTLNDTKSTQLVVPASGINNPIFSPPISTKAGDDLTFTTLPATTTLLAGAQGHKS